MSIFGVGSELSKDWWGACFLFRGRFVSNSSVEVWVNQRE